MTDEEEEKQKIQEQAERESKEKAAKEKEALDKKPIQPTPGEEGKEKAESKSPLEEARALDKSIKEGTAKIQKLLEKHEKILADVAVTGKGFAGQAPTAPKTDDEKWAEEAKERYAGTGMDPTTPVKEEVTYS